MVFCDEGTPNYKRQYEELSKVNAYLQSEIAAKEYDSWDWIKLASRDDGDGQ